jgi:hypothetical protein
MLFLLFFRLDSVAIQLGNEPPEAAQADMEQKVEEESDSVESERKVIGYKGAAA